MSDILKTQRSLVRKAITQTEHRFGDLYHLICRKDWIEEALIHVLNNTGARTAGVDGVSRKRLRTENQQEAFVAELQADLRAGIYQPMPVKRIWIPKPGKTEKRGLGIPTIRDRVVQELLRMLMEPVWESDFLNCSHGFRPGRCTMDCISFFYSHVQTSNKYYWAIEGDIRKCFDRINHRILLRLIRQRIADHRVVGLVRAFLKAGLMDNGLFMDTPEGTPQGGILSPLLANIYLHQFDLWWWQKFGSLTPHEKQKRRKAKQGNAILVRYADDWVILWNGMHQGAQTLRDEIRQFLRDELHLELSGEKTHVTHFTDGVDFLGFHIQYIVSGKRDGKPWLRVTPTKKNVARFRHKIKTLTRHNTTFATPEMKLKSLNRVIRGWGNYYRHVSFKHEAHRMDFWINERVLIWLRHKHDGKGVRWVLRRYKHREVTGRYDRWNLGVEGSNGKMIFIAKLTDIPSQRYRRRNLENPYLHATEVPTNNEHETQFVEPGVVNIAPNKLKWAERRTNVLKRDGYRCIRCNSTKPLDVHHKIARQHGGTDDLDNLETLCRKCHQETPTYLKSLRGENPMESRMTRKCHVRFGREGE
ncbi:MAG: group II intron reverse transcriptase/maturase [Ardenticatenia bacterium]|nr:group II intron reverse transcriptase/maturase [Ardenticatenia bacterium]